MYTDLGPDTHSLLSYGGPDSHPNAIERCLQDRFCLYDQILPRSSNLLQIAMVRVPDTSDTLVETLDRLLRPPIDLARRVPQQLDFVEYLIGIQILHAHRSRLAVDIVGYDCGVFLRSGGDGDLDFGVFGSERGEM